MKDSLKVPFCDQCDDTGYVAEDAFDEEGRAMRGAGKVKKCVCITKL